MPARRLVISPRNGGFFCNFNCVLSNIDRYLGKDGITGAEVVWRTQADITHFMYGRTEDGNVWLHFFYQLQFDDLPADRIVVAGFPEHDVFRITWIDAYATYRLGIGWRRKYHALFNKFIKIRPFLVDRADTLFRAGMAGRFCVGVHYRNPLHARECLRPIPPPEVFVARARRLLPAGRPAAIVLASDFEPAVDAFRAAFGDALVVQPEVTRAASLSQDQLHHAAAHPGLALGEQVLVDCLLLARCDVLLHVTSNVATAAAYINPKLRLVYCETRAEAVRGTLWSVSRVVVRWLCLTRGRVPAWMKPRVLRRARAGLLRCWRAPNRRPAAR